MVGLPTQPRRSFIDSQAYCGKYSRERSGFSPGILRRCTGAELHWRACLRLCFRALRAASFLPRTAIACVSFAESRGSRRLADQAQPFAFRIIPDETGAVEKHGGVLGRIIGGPAGKPCVVRIPAPCEMHPCLADIPGKGQRRRSSTGLTNAESRIVENECDLASVERAGPSLQCRRPPTENVLIGGRATECGLAFALRDVDLAPGGGRNGSPEPEWSRLGILPAIGLHDVPPSNSPALADALLQLLSRECIRLRIIYAAYGFIEV